MTKLAKEIKVVKDWTNGLGYWATCKEAGQLTFKVGNKEYEGVYKEYHTGYFEVEIKVAGGSRKVTFKKEKHMEIVSEIRTSVEGFVEERCCEEVVEETILTTELEDGEEVLIYWETMGNNFLNEESARYFLGMLEARDEITKEYAYSVEDRGYSWLLGESLLEIWYDEPFEEWVIEDDVCALRRKTDDLESLLQMVRKEVLK